MPPMVRNEATGCDVRGASSSATENPPAADRFVAGGAVARAVAFGPTMRMRSSRPRRQTTPAYRKGRPVW